VYHPKERQAFFARLDQAGIDVDTRNLIVKQGDRGDVPPILAREWAMNAWDSQAVSDLASLPQADRALLAYQRVLAFWDGTRQDRVSFALASSDAALQFAARVADRFRAELLRFDEPFLVRLDKLGKVKYVEKAERDIELPFAYIEVFHKNTASGKVRQVNLYFDPAMNPVDPTTGRQKPLFHFVPTTLPPRSRQALLAGDPATGHKSAGVFDDLDQLELAYRSLP
jgi:hypothetical protein